MAEVQIQNNQPSDRDSGLETEEESDMSQQAEAAGDGELSENAQTELLLVCQKLLAKQKMLQDEIILTERDSGENPQEPSVNLLKAIEADLKLCQETVPKVLCTNPEVLAAVGIEEIQKVNTQMKMLHARALAKRDQLQESLKREQELLREQKDLLEAATAQVETLKQEKSKQTEEIVLQEMRVKFKKMKAYQEKLKGYLTDILEEHMPVPGDDTDPNRRKRNTSQRDVDLISMNEILELLMNKTLESPHDAYITIDDTFWPPYIEMLLRGNIAVRHPENANKIRLVPVT